MPNDQELKQMRSTLIRLKEELVKYQEMYEEDGEINTKERRDLDARLLKVYKLEIAINKAAGDNPEPIQWGDIEHEYGQEVNSRIHEAMTASDRAKGYITQENESSGSMVISAMLSIIASFGPQYAVAVEIYKAAASTMKSAPPDNLTDFHREWIRGLESQKGKKTGYRDFKTYFDTQYLSDCTEDEITHTTVLSVMKSYVSSHFLTREQMEQFYVHSWINSAQDETNWLGFNDHDDEAGYIQIRARYQYPPLTLFNASTMDRYKDGMWFKDDIYFDDMARPKGTNNALAGVHGSGKKLSELPFKVKVNFQMTSMPNQRPLGWVGTCLFERSTSGQWAVKMGSNELLQLFINDCFNSLTVKDLGVE